jgi:septum formation protein
MLYLASTSARRRLLLAAAGLDFRLVAPGPEPAGTGSPEERALARAQSKARGARVAGPPGWVLGADTVVEVGGRELGKPVDRADARSMLEQLSDRTHRVHTAVCLIGHERAGAAAEVATSVVRCRALSQGDIDDYLETGAWRDKAGAYGIQEPACGFLELVSGQLDTVIGLPIATLRAVLARLEGATR